jgi:hypothetical protein
MSAAQGQASDGREAGAPDDPAAGEPAASRRRQLTFSARARRAGVRYLRGLAGRRLPARHETGRAAAARGAVRGFLLTPWFAAGSGFVLAAAIFLYAPHADLIFPSGKPAQKPCSEQGCKKAPSASAPGLAGTPGAPITDPSSATHGSAAKKGAHPGAGSGRDAATGLTFGFKVVWQQDDNFGALVTVTGNRALTSWRLRFAMRGTTIKWVSGATWQPSAAGDGGLATPLASGDNASQASGDQSSSLSSEQGHASVGGALIQFMISGNGTAHMPGHCRFDGVRCKFGQTA